MPTPAHRAGRALIRIAGPIIIAALLALAIINAPDRPSRTPSLDS